MDMFVVRGGRRLAGRVAVSGAKNAALPIMAASILASGPSVIWGVPELADVRTLSQLLQTLGMNVLRGAAGEILLDVHDRKACVADYDLVRKMRASICVLGPLVARRGFAAVSLPGGCAIGDRPVDLHLKGLAALGADIKIERGYIIAKARRLRGAGIYLGGAFGSTVTGTCNVMSAATLAAGVTTIEAAACEPEVVDLGNYLNAMGARISGLGTPFLRIEGVEELVGTQHEIIPDRIEAATLMLGAAITRGDVVLDNVRLDHLTAVLEKLREMGVRIDSVVDEEPGATGSLSARAASRVTANSPGGHAVRATPRASVVRIHVPGELRSADCIMLPYPGLPTDVQAQLMALLTTVPGFSIVTDKVFPDRFMHAAEMTRMGARIRREGASAIVSGVVSLSGACVMASDLRASAALVLAGLAADGESLIRRIYHLDRGYDRLEHKLNLLGAGIARMEDTAANMPASLRPSALERPAETDDPDAEVKPPRWLGQPADRRTGIEQKQTT
jgi:UDP-N-acetylglucosamine 1-carboxyvinyltransferase